MIKAYLNYLKKRNNAHGIHSPFVFEFYNEIVKKAKDETRPKIENLRKSLLKNTNQITITDLGAGSKRNKTNIRSVAEITKNAASPAKYGRLLSRIISHYGLSSVLELGTSMGIGTAYMSSNSTIKTLTLEGCAEIGKQAKQNFEKLALTNIESRIGEFTDLLTAIEAEDKKFDLIYIDGNHQLAPTLAYFEFALKNSSENAFIIFDDIHWSIEMEAAWIKIKADKRINVSMDLFKLGIVCKRKGQRKENFILKY